jgi:hypothetical protein
MSTSDYTAEMFSGEQIAGALAKLDGYERWRDIATLADGQYEAETFEAFAKLARTLKAPIATEYGALKVRRERSLDERRGYAIGNLRRQAERGEIEPAYLYGKPDED